MNIAILNNILEANLTDPLNIEYVIIVGESHVNDMISILIPVLLVKLISLLTVIVHTILMVYKCYCWQHTVKRLEQLT